MRATNTNSALISVDWPLTSVVAFSTTRLSPSGSKQSQSPFNDFNIATHVDDELADVLVNRKSLAQYLPPDTQIQWLNQIHGNHVATIEKFTEAIPDADAAITSKKNIALAIMTADCLPILLIDELNQEIAAIHAGWRPLAKQIIDNTVKQMSGEPSNIKAWLGPCISARSFEVGKEVFETFTQLDPQLTAGFTAQKDGKYLADLQFIAEYQLRHLGVVDIACDKSCTYIDETRFYSYRRDGVTGRMATIICLK